MKQDARELYRCDVCLLEQEDDDNFDEECPQCGTLDQFYLVEGSDD